MSKPLVTCMGMLTILLASPTATVQAQTLEQLIPFIQDCIINTQLIFGYEEQFATVYCEDIYRETGNVLTPQERELHISFWEQYYGANVQQPITPGDVPQLDMERLHDDWLCTVPFDSFPGSGLDQPQPSFREAC